MLGYGGASKAIVYGLISKGFTSVLIFNRSKKAITVKNIKKYTKKYSLINKHLPNADLIINTTPTNPLTRTQTKLIEKKTILSDIVYSPKNTVFLNNFKENKKIHGISMLLEQAVLCFYEWFGFEPKADKALIKKINIKIR